MHAALRLQVAESIVSLHLNRRRLYACILTFEQVGDCGLVAIALGPAKIHPHQHRAPIVRFSSAGTRIYRKHSLERVSLLSEHIPQFQFLDLLHRICVGLPQFFLFFRFHSILFCGFRSGGFLRKLIKHVQIFHSPKRLVVSVHPKLQSGSFLEKSLRSLCIVPKIRSRCLFLPLCHLSSLFLHIHTFPQKFDPLVKFLYLFCRNHTL